MVAAAGLQRQVWFLAACQEGAPAGISFGVGVMQLQPTRLRVGVPPQSHPQQIGDPTGAAWRFAAAMASPDQVADAEVVRDRVQLVPIQSGDCATPTPRR